MACSKEAMRIVLWMSWVICWLFNSIFVAITLISFTQLWEASSVYLAQGGTNFYSNRNWRAPMASCILSALLVIGYDLLSCITLIKKHINRAGPGFGFGFIVAFTFTLSWFLLLVGLVLDSFRPKVKQLEQFDWTVNGTVTTDFKWSNGDTSTFYGAEVLAIINFVVLLIFACMLVILQTGVSEQLGIESTHYAPLESIPMAGATVTDGYADGHDQSHGAPGQYAYVGNEQGDVQGQGGHAYDAQGAASMRGEGGYYAPDYQGYQAPNGASTTPAGGQYYGHAAYGASATTDTYNYTDGVAAQEPGAGLLGGQAIGSAPAAQPQQGYAPPAAVPGGYAYQQF